MMSVADFEQKQILFAFLDEGEKISFRNDNILILDNEGSILHQSTCYRLFAVLICGHVCITSGLMERAERFRFTIIFLTHSMRPYAIFPARAEGNVLLRKKQYQYSSLGIGASITSNKIANQSALLSAKRHKTEFDNSAIAELDKYRMAVLDPELTIHEIMGNEGIAAKLYFRALFADYSWTARRPRVKQDPVNCLMDIGYTLLFNIIDALLQMYGFDTYVGVLHREFFNRKSLSCDLVEPFRPIIDSSILKSLHLGQVKEADFIKQGPQYFLYGKAASPYIKRILEAILEYKDDVFLYVQGYYRAFMRDKSPEDFPRFAFGGKEGS